MIDTFQKAALAAHFADSKKAEDITILDVRGLCNFADAFLICNGNNKIQLRAISDAIAEGLKKQGCKGPIQDGQRTTSWAVLDFGDLVVHIMSAEARTFYRLEKLWGDAKELNWTDELEAAKAAAAAN